MVTSCQGTVAYSTLLKERKNGKEEQKGDVSSYGMAITLNLLAPELFF